ncbi:hypothetical protein PLICRDRAFT_141216 [Plicaturopsis crispa FD-325 SS-3]|nr:hypothetical protein PLICRDRAFT_141216 [Plicaturopsis crispa FD-325 SS-3]
MATVDAASGFVLDEDEEIEVVHHKKPERLRCLCCNMDLEKKTPDQRCAHYDQHFPEGGAQTSGATVRGGAVEVDDSANVSSSSSIVSSYKSLKPGMSPVKKLWHHGPREDDPFWYSAHTSAPPQNFTPGLIPVLRRALIKTHAKDITTKAVLCYDRTVHISRGMWDVSWGCGYRNFMMACTALMDQDIQPRYSQLLLRPVPPSVRNLQQMIETAWHDGFDAEGADELKHELLGTSKWIGTGDLWVAFVHRGIPAKLVDFDLRKGKHGVEVVTNWVVEYFSGGKQAPRTLGDALMGASAVTVAKKMPLILQHDGHSRTIVGYEVAKKGVVNLLTFDPSRPPNRELRDASLTSSSAPASSSRSQQSVSARANGKRKASVQSASSSKRVRGGSRESVYDVDADDDEVEIVSESHRGGSAEQVAGDERLDASETVKFFRLNPKKLGRKNQYQILYFPLTDPLTESERLSKKCVTSTRIC